VAEMLVARAQEPNSTSGELHWSRFLAPEAASGAAS